MKGKQIRKRPGGSKRRSAASTRRAVRLNQSSAPKIQRVKKKKERKKGHTQYRAERYQRCSWISVDTVPEHVETHEPHGTENAD